MTPFGCFPEVVDGSAVEEGRMPVLLGFGDSAFEVEGGVFSFVSVGVFEESQCDIAVGVPPSGTSRVWGGALLEEGIGCLVHVFEQGGGSEVEGGDVVNEGVWAG